MTRQGSRRAKRWYALRRTAYAAPRPSASNGNRPAAALAPDAASHLSDGVVVETRLVARLLGLRILRVDGVVHLAPARLERWPTAAEGPGAEGHQLGEGLARASRLLADNDARTE
jgi:hypothetical protein